MRLRMAPRANAGLRAMPPASKRAMRRALRSLADDPTGEPDGLDVAPFRFAQQADYWRLRIGSFRALFAIRSGELVVLEVFPRKRGYRWLEERYG